MQQIPFFMANERSPLGCFCIYHPPQINLTEGHILGMVLYVHPFAEEMNKSRQMAARQSRELAQAGFAVLQIDLSGCGDSAGEFAEATWETWIQDIRDGYRWLELNVGPDLLTTNNIPLWLWGLRAGCLLAVEASQQLNRACSFIFWQPSLAGKIELTQFMRLQRASNMLNGTGADTKKNVPVLSINESSIDVLGYTLSPELARGFTQATLSPPPKIKPNQHLVWLEMKSSEHTEFSPASTEMLKHWHETGINTVNHLVKGPSFWRSTEILHSSELIALTCSSISALSRQKLELDCR
jgi:exosortase A-associated hydrolase 2